MNSIKVDSDSNPLRDQNGFCIRCEPGSKIDKLSHC